MDNYDNFSQIPDNPVDPIPEASVQPEVVMAEQPVVAEYSSEPISEGIENIGIKWYQRGWGKAILAIIALLILLFIVVAILLSLSSRNDASLFNSKIDANNLFSTSTSPSVVSSSMPSVSSSQDLITQDPVRILAEKTDRPIWGNPSSTFVIVEFADFQCSVCEAEFPTIRSFITKHKNEVLYIFRNFIVEDENSNLLAQASLCANDQGKFWILHDKLYTNFGNISSIADLQSLVQSIGMDWSKIAQCIQSGKYVNQVTQDISDAQNLGVAGTPTFFVNGNKLEGAISTEDWEAILSRYKQITTQK